MCQEHPQLVHLLEVGQCDAKDEQLHRPGLGTGVIVEISGRRLITRRDGVAQVHGKSTKDRINSAVVGGQTIII